MHLKFEIYESAVNVLIYYSSILVYIKSALVLIFGLIIRMF
jgi:hypothetical protein